jgi:Cys-tRNA(Pro) deacylase
MAKEKIPVTPAIRQIRKENADFTPHLYDYEEKGGAAQSADKLGVPLNSVIKTLIFDTGNGLVAILMHGGMEVSAKELARTLGVKNAVPADSKSATNATGYVFGGTSPFGLRKNLPVYAEETIFALERVYINGGKQGFLIEINPDLLITILNAEKINVAI